MDLIVAFPFHAREQMHERGATEDEVRQVLHYGEMAEAKAPRLGRRMVFTEGYTWRGQFYPHKLVRIIYLVQPEKISMVTVYVYYGKWEV